MVMLFTYNFYIIFISVAVDIVYFNGFYIFLYKRDYLRDVCDNMSNVINLL